MTDDRTTDTSREIHVTALACRRTGQMFSPTEHARCPYCYADAPQVEATGDYTTFCDFKPGEDPINFGFPADSTRTRHG